MKLKGRVWVFGDNIDTDTIFPARVFTEPDHVKIKACMESIRPGWSSMVNPGDILIAGRNFGTGSSRPASLILKMVGISAVAAESIFGVFLRNSINYGLPALECPGVSKMFREGDVALIDLESYTVENTATGSRVACRRLPAIAVEILRSGGLINYLRRRGCI